MAYSGAIVTRPVVGRASRTGAVGTCCALLLALASLANADQAAIEEALAVLNADTIQEFYRSRLAGIHFSADVRLQMGRGSARGAGGRLFARGPAVPATLPPPPSRKRTSGSR